MQSSTLNLLVGPELVIAHHANLKNSFCQIDSNNGRLIHGGYLLNVELMRHHFGTLMPFTGGTHLVTHHYRFPYLKFHLFCLSVCHSLSISPVVPSTILHLDFLTVYSVYW